MKVDKKTLNFIPGINSYYCMVRMHHVHAIKKFIYNFYWAVSTTCRSVYSHVISMHSGGYRRVAMVSTEPPSENSARPKFIDESSCG